MTRSIQQIKRDIDNIEKKVTLISEQLYNLYNQYLALLNQSVVKQLILACYQVCTQIYPESFLKLSYNQREQVQQNIRKISQEDFTELLNTLTDDESTEETISFTNPLTLIEWQSHLEKSIETKLEELSNSGNNCLQKAGILPEQIPAKVLEMAIESEESGPAISSPANLLYLLIETEENEVKDSANITKITAICLRLSELEFSNPNLNAQRNQIRQISEQISQLEQQYRRQKQELAIAEAEAAWRSSWHM